VARSINSDPLMSYNFALIDVPTLSAAPLAFPIKTIMSAVTSGTFVGFESISMPTLSLSTREIKEGNWPFVHRVLDGHASAGEVVLRQAVLTINYDFYFWLKQALWGRIAPRRHFAVVHLRNDKRIPQRLICLSDCLPTSWKPANDLSATSNEVVIEELSMIVTDVSVIPLPIPLAPPSAPQTPNL